MEAVFLGMFVIKEAPPPQEMLIQILNAINSFINSPLFTEYGKIGLFINGVFSTFIPFPPEVTAISLVVAGNSRIEILAILSTSWIIGAAVGYYAGLSGKKLADLFKSRREETDKPGEEGAGNDNNETLPRFDHKIHNGPINGSGHRHRHEKKDEGKHK
ncbi:MAG: hypothetical protein M3311_05825, partial [Thermoproteota archaeon]|nr:hypothetical protein [Thermoproteota archaeon]